MIEIKIKEIKQICGITEDKKDAVLTSKLPIVNQLIEDITIKRIYNQVVRKSARPIVINAFKSAFAYFVYFHAIDFLDETKRVGFDTSKDTLSHDEIERRRWHLELFGYSVIKDYLNEDGKKRYIELKNWDDLRRANDPRAKDIIMQEMAPNKPRLRVAIV